MNQPNLFHYATKELSQDAVICWLLSWVHIDYRESVRGDLVRTGRRFLAALLTKHKRYGDITEDHIECLTELKPQYKKIDVYVQARVRGHGTVSVIIEDKVEAPHHSGQLRRYVAEILGDDEPEDDLVGIYFKTGLITEHDRQLPDEFVLFDRGDFLEFLRKEEIDHPIAREYLSYLTGIERNQRILRQEVRRADRAIEVLTNHSAQWYLAESIFRSKGFADAHTLSEQCELYNGTNNDGSPWTQFRFYELEVPSRPDCFFYRIDYRICRRGTQKRRLPYVALRKWQDHDASPAASAAALKRFKVYKKAVDRALDRAQQRSDFTLIAGKPVPDNKGNKEQELLTFFVAEDMNTPEELIRCIPQLHREVCEQLKTIDNEVLK